MTSGLTKELKMAKVVITSVGITYDTRLECGPSHYEGRIGPPLAIQEKNIPDALKEQILALAQKHAKEYWGVA